jgi:hypothetical protein
MFKTRLIKVIEKDDLNQSVLPDDEEEHIIAFKEPIIHLNNNKVELLHLKTIKSNACNNSNYEKESHISLDPSNMNNLFIKKFPKVSENGIRKFSREKCSPIKGNII